MVTVLTNNICGFVNNCIHWRSIPHVRHNSNKGQSPIGRLHGTIVAATVGAIVTPTDCLYVVYTRGNCCSDRLRRQAIRDREQLSLRPIAAIVCTTVGATVVIMSIKSKLYNWDPTVGRISRQLHKRQQWRGTDNAAFHKTYSCCTTFLLPIPLLYCVAIFSVHVLSSPI